MGDDRDLHLPADGPAVAAAVVLHPHPAMGGDRHHPLVVAVATGLAEAGIAAMRLDLRHPAVEISADVVAATADELRASVEVEQLFLIGYSWGAAVVARATVDTLTARVLVALPVTMLDLPPQPEPALVLVPAHDQYGPPAEVRAAMAGWPDATVELVDGCDHFLVGAVGRISERAVTWLTEPR